MKQDNFTLVQFTLSLVALFLLFAFAAHIDYLFSNL